MTDSSETKEPAETGAEGRDPTEPFSIKGGSRVRYGHRTGRVEVVRGGGPIPYEVRIGWEGQKYPEWFQYGTLRILHKNGELQVL